MAMENGRRTLDLSSQDLGLTDFLLPFCSREGKGSSVHNVIWQIHSVMTGGNSRQPKRGFFDMQKKGTGMLSLFLSLSVSGRPKEKSNGFFFKAGTDEFSRNSGAQNLTRS